ncbi:probable helicase senataxin [Melopsittacus undulatus]|uniref:probable helicase senataxin n=1 Tax=Melopsittacus undulatus TaxID=13146 RepID=UPI00146F69EB|nr:probable helicase senataxin [Melopsittacus undulatus]
MSTCRWCTPGGPDTTEFLKSYASKRLPLEDLEGSNEDLCYCLECVLEYHKAKEKLPGLHEVLWKLETSRLVAHIEKSMQEEAGEDDELFVVDENGQTQLSGYVGPDFENNLRVPLLEVLKYPYLLLHERVSELCVEVLCRMERSHSSFQVFEKYPGIYLFLVHPNEVIRRWAILTARNLGKVDRDDYYDLQEVLTCLFKVIELGLFESQDIYRSSMVEKGKLILLPSHLYDTANYKDYWLGICMLLTVLEEEALDSLLLGPDKQNDFMQSILHTMEKEAADESTDPFWPALHCFMVILDQLGSKVWGQLIDPVQAFQTIINSVSYNSEIKNIRNSFKRTKIEPESDYNDDMVTCSQIVYSYNTEKPQKDTGWKTAICPDYCPNMYEDMQALANMLQSAIGRGTRIHQSTFLWFIPFVQSLMDLKDLGVAYIVEVIHYLCSEIKGILNERIQQCDKVSEFFLLILVSIIELHRKKKCLHLLWISSQEWVEAVVKCTMLPAIAFTQCTEKLPGQCVRSSLTVSLQASNSVQHACVQLIRSLLKEGYQIGQHTLCKQYLDKLNLLLRGNLSLGWQLNIQETQELQVCLRQVIRGIKNRALDTSVAAGNDAISTTLPIKQEKSSRGGGCEMSVYGRDDLHSLCAVSSKEGRVCSSFFKSEPGMQENEDDGIMLSGFSGTLLRKVSTGLKSSSLLKSEIRNAPDMQASDSKQLSLNDLAKYNCEDQISKSCFTDKTSTNGCVQLSSENKYNISSPASRIRPLSVKCKSSDRLLEFSKYFKRESNSVGKKEEGFMKTVSEDNTLTDSQVDRELSKLSLAAYAKSVNFSFDSSQESSLDDNVCDIKRKVKGVIRSSSDGQRTTSPCDSDCLNNKVIIISDSSDEENPVADKKETKKYENGYPEEQPSTSSCASGSDTKTESKVPSSLLSLEDCESQYFEFETELDVYSVWQDTQDYSMEVTQKYKEGHVSALVGSNDSDDLLDDHTNEWGYDTDYVNDDNMEEEANLTGKTENLPHQTEADNTKVATDSALQESVGKENAKDQLENSAGKGTIEDFTLHSKLTEPSTSKISLASKLALKKNSASPQKSIANSKVARTVQRSPKKPVQKPVRKPAQTKTLLQSKLKTSQPGSSMPAVVPPKKVRQCPAPASTVEKLGLKKAPRRAFELSQRSLESLAQLRSYGKAAGRIGVAQKQKIKLIAPQSLSIKHNKKLLACQDLQYLRQTMPKRRVGVGNPSGSSGSRNRKASKLDTKLKKQKPGRFEVASVETQGEGKRVCTGFPSAGEREFESLFVEEEETGVSKMPGFSDINIKSKDNGMMVPPVPEYSSPSSSALVGDGKNEPSGNDCVVQPECEKTKDNGCKLNENSDDDDLFLTQLDPVDMDLCSEEESVQDTTTARKNTEEMDTDKSLQQSESLTVVKCKYKDCNEKVEKPGEYCSKHSATSSEADHLFAKPSLLPPKPRKPSTTKIFSSASSSRNAAFSKDLEDVKKLPPASKSKVNVAKPVVVRPPNAKPIPTRNQTCKSPSFINVPQSNIPNNVLQSQNRQNGNASNISRRPVQEAYSSPFYVQQHDHSIFITEVLRWTYEMFMNSSLFGPPSNLTQSLVAAVPIHFQGYNDYFNTFFPLMMLNAFETLAQEWIENQKVREKSYYFNLQSFSADLNTADFTAHLRESDLAKQLHPKEDDLIFLVVQKKKDPFREDSEMEDQIVNEVGLVTRFSRASGRATRQKEQHTICHLSVRTRGNLSFFVNKQVKCMVVGSLVTTHRTFKGLLLLSRSPLAKPIINPSYNDFCPRDLPVASESTAWNVNEYNEDQKRAIETAYAMVKQHPGLPKICLIHGPPGTGKSKTIVGLLSRVLKENTRNEKTQKTNSKIKPNRFLVCAPSNAAVDELMKKIIIAFKEKCQNRQEPLGNCGDIKLVRLGAEKAINSEVRGFSLDKQVEHRMKRKPADCDQDIQKKKAALDQKLDMLSRQRAMHRCEKKESQMLDDEIGRLTKERQQLASQLKEVRGHSQKVQADIILESDIICCTLSTSGGCLLESVFFRQGLDPFSCVIVDEAGQSCEVETLIPLIHRCNKLVLVGDPRQLPPTVKSVKAQEYGYDQSLMARLHRHLEDQVHKNILRSLPVVQLTVQYRMHPDICLFPSNYVYGRTLKTDRATEENRCSSEWPFQPYLIFDVGDGHEERNNDSFSNPQEVKLVMELIRTIKEKRKDLGLRRIGIITPYSAQKKRIQEQLDRVFRNNSPEVDTVDAFQGREKDCIIVTCVRANSTKGSIGFLASLQRLNVTITRARFSLFILGRLKTLMESKDWNELIQDAQKRGAIIKTSEKSYRKDAGKILKLKPSVQPPASAGAKQPPPTQLSSSGKKPLANPQEARSPQELPAGTGCAVPQGSGGPQQPQCAQAVNSRRGSAPARMVSAMLPADQEKPRDPRLASMASRTEARGKEQASKDSSHRDQSNTGSTSQQGFDASSAARDQISRTETFKKPQQTSGQCDLPSTARHEGDQRAPPLKSVLKSHSEGGESCINKQNKDYCALTSEESPVNTDSNSAKRRKMFH